MPSAAIEVPNERPRVKIAGEPISEWRVVHSLSVPPVADLTMEICTTMNRANPASPAELSRKKEANAYGDRDLLL